MQLLTFILIILGVSFVPCQLDISNDEKPNSDHQMEGAEGDPTIVVADCANGTLYNIDVDFTSTVVENGLY